MAGQKKPDPIKRGGEKKGEEEGREGARKGSPPPVHIPGYAAAFAQVQF